MVLGEALVLTVGALLTVELLCLQSVEVPVEALLRHTSHCQQRSSIVSKAARIVSKKAQIVSRKAPKHNCKQKCAAVSRKLPIVSKKVASNDFSQRESAGMVTLTCC